MLTSRFVLNVGSVRYYMFNITVCIECRLSKVLHVNITVCIECRLSKVLHV